VRAFHPRVRVDHRSVAKRLLEPDPAGTIHVAPIHVGVTFLPADEDPDVDLVLLLEEGDVSDASVAATKYNP
jgi:hypothetical protein